MSTSKPKPIYPKGSPPRPVYNEIGSSSSRAHGKYVATACENCKRSKRKCDGNTPCQTCNDKGIPCQYDETKDGRRGRKRTLDELHAKVDALDVVLDSIRANDDGALAHLIKLVRSEASVYDIASYARSIINDDSRQDSHNRTRSAVMSIANLTDEPYIRVPAKPWTTITDNDHFVSHLISAYFTWHHESYPCVQKDVFLRAMSEGNLDSEFCSPFLVNCLLLTACIYSDHPLVFAYDHDNSTRGLHFADEVARLWAEEDGKATLTNLQGLVALSMGLGLVRKDRQAMLYVRHLPVTCIELGRRVKYMIKEGQVFYASDEYQRSLRLARWSAFSIEVDFCMIWVKPLALAKPYAPRPYTAEDLQTRAVWTPYPRTGPTSWYVPHGLYAVKFDLREIGGNIVPVMLSGDPEDSPMPGHTTLDHAARRRLLEDLSTQLQGWRDALPSYARLDMELALSWSLLEVHLVWHDYCVTVYSLMLRDMDDADSYREKARTSLLESCHEIAKILAYMRRSLGTASMWCPWTFQAAAMAAFPLVDLLAEPGVQETFQIIVATLSTAAERWILAKGVLKMLWIMLQERNQVTNLLPAIGDLFRAQAVDNWGPAEYRMFSGCMYPNYTVIGERGRELADMGELLEEWSQLSLGGSEHRLS